MNASREQPRDQGQAEPAALGFLMSANLFEEAGGKLVRANRHPPPQTAYWRRRARIEVPLAVLAPQDVPGVTGQVPAALRARL
jgi:hypothetical protein